MHSIVNAMLSCGMMAIPVGVCKAAGRKNPEFRTLHRECGRPIKMPRMCPECDVSLDPDDLVKGYEVAKDTFIMIDDDELAAVSAERSKVIQLAKFVPSGEIVSPLLYETTYYLDPPGGALGKHYKALVAGMEHEGVMGIGISSLWGKEYPSAVGPIGGGVLGLALLYCSDEVRSTAEIKEKQGNVSLSEQEEKMARKFVRMMSEPLSPEDLITPSRVRIDEYLLAKIAGSEIKIPTAAPEPEGVPDLIEALRMSMERVAA